MKYLKTREIKKEKFNRHIIFFIILIIKQYKFIKKIDRMVILKNKGGYKHYYGGFAKKSPVNG